MGEEEEEVEEGKQDDVDSNKKKENDTLAHGKHYYVFVVQSITRNGPPIRFIAARYCVANLSHRWLRAKLEYIEPTLAFYGFTVCSESFDGASENRSCMAHRTTLTFEDLCRIQLKKIVSDELENVNDIANNDNKIDGDSSNSSSSSSSSSISINSDMDESTESISNNSEDENKKCRYTEHQLPWTMPIAFYHPSIEGIIIVAAGDMPHGLKKMRNAMHLSGKEDKVRDLHNFGLPINLKMALDTWRETPDSDPNQTSALMLYPKITLSVLCPTSKSAMRTSDAARAMGNQMMEMLIDNGHKNKKAGPRTFDAFILHCYNTDHWVNVMNASPLKGCETIKSDDHRHIYDLCDYIRYLTEWKNAVMDKNEFFPLSTYQDVCYTSLGVVVLALTIFQNIPDMISFNLVLDRIRVNQLSC